MTKKLFVNKAAEIKKKKQILISQELDQKIIDIEKRAERQGIAFPLNEHVEDAIQKLIRAAESQLKEIEGSSMSKPSFGKIEKTPTA